MPQFIYTMKGLGKVHPPDHVVLEDIWLSFLPGAKIGVLGLNGAGKSSLLRDHGGRGHAASSARRFRPTASSVGFLQQEPQLDPTKTVLGNVEEGVAETQGAARRATTRSTRSSARICRPRRWTRSSRSRRKVQDKIDAANAWDLDSRLELAMDALRLPPPDADVTTLSGGERRRVALCRLLLQSPDLLLLDEPTNHLDAESVAWLERFLKDYPGTVVAVTHDRYFLDNVAGWILELDRGRGHPVGRQLLVLARAEAEAPGAGREGRDQAAADARSASSNGSACRRARARRRARRASTPTRSCCSEDTAQKIEHGRDLHPARARGSATSSSRRAACGRATATTLLIDDLNFTLPRGGIVGVIGPNGAGKTTLFRMITGQEKPDGGTLRLGETVQVGYVDQSRDALDAEQDASAKRSPAATTRSSSGKRKVASRAYVSWFNFKGARSAAEGRRAVGRRAQPRAPGEAAEEAAATCCCSTSRPTTSTSTRCARSKRRCSTSPAAPSSSATTAGSSTASRRTCSRSRATARWSGSRATTRTTRPTGSAGSAPRPTSRTGSSTGS